MEKVFVNNYLIANGKYFPNSKLNKIGEMLENSNASEYSINKRYFNPLFITILFWVFYPLQLFDRLLLKDWFWGIIKLFTPFVLSYFIYQNGYTIPLGFNSPARTIIISIFVLWALWLIVDGFTIYKRTKIANYRAFLRALNIDEYSFSADTVKITKSTYNDDSAEDIVKWKEANPSLSLNDYFKNKK